MDVNYKARHDKARTMCIFIEMHCSPTPDSTAHGANMGPTWGRQDPGGPHDGLMNFAIWDVMNIMSCVP